MVDENALREKYIESQVIERQLGDVQKQIKGIDEQITELSYIIQSFDEIKEVKEGSEAWVPLHNGVFIKAKLMDTSSFAINVGSDTVVTKDRDHAKNIFRQQLQDLSQIRANLENSYMKLAEMSKKTQGEVHKLIEDYEAQNV